MKHIKELDYILSSKKDMSILAQNELKNINTSESVIKNSYICHQITHVDDKIANLILGNKAIFETNFQKPNFSKVAYIIYLYEYFLINVVSVQDTLLHVINNIYGLNIKNHNVHYNKNFIKKIKNFPNIKSKLDEYNTYISGIDGCSEMKGMQN
ncbi:MAG: Cthe_2314 family HEPN domain-containing protein, partial [Minisyncoccia bacterium]